MGLKQGERLKVETHMTTVVMTREALKDCSRWAGSFEK